MRKIRIEAEFQAICTNELSDADKQLRDKTFKSAANAYARYSHFCVGAVALLSDGTVVEGNNQENIAYPSGLCAERVALFAAGAAYPNLSIVTLAIAALKDGEMQPFITPCGACRQVMLESELRQNSPIRILMCGRDETVNARSASALMPMGFDADKFNL